MRGLVVLAILTSLTAAAEVRTVTLREAVRLALRQNPEVAMARLDEAKASEAVREAKDPFIPKLVAGSGLAYSSGFPMSIEGATPSIVQAQASQFVFNRPQTHLLAAARESVRGAAIGAAATRETVALRVATAYLEAERASRLAEGARRNVESFEKIAAIVRLRVEEGRELPVEAKRAELQLARARQRLVALEADLGYAEASLAALLGLNIEDGVRAAGEDRSLPLLLPAGEEECAQAAIDSSKELRRLESALAAKGLQVRAENAAKLPRVDLVAQYALLGRFNNYEDFFNKFQRHNGQIGVSFQIPIFTGYAVAARTAQAKNEESRLRLELQSARSQVALESRRLYQQVKQAEAGRDVARLDLEVARDQVSVLLARMEEGKAALRQVEEARLAEDEKWMAFMNASYSLETARLNLLHQTGALLAALE